MTNATGAPAELLQVTGMRRCLKGIRHQQSTPFSSFNDGLPIRVLQRYLGFPGTSRPFRCEGSQGRTSAAESPAPSRVSNRAAGCDHQLRRHAACVLP